jgi:dephospho-CoA kinase
MLMLKKIAITGGIATGKTQVLKIFKKLGSYTLNADEIVHTLLKKNKKIKLQIIKNFGKEILENNKINKKKIAEIVFKDIEKLAILEKIIHPEVFKEIKKDYKKVKNENFNFFVVEMPLLFEIGAQKYFDITITVSAKEEIAKKRYKYKDYINRKKRLMSLKEKGSLSDFAITNNQTLSNLEKKIIKISKTIKKL